ncbi:MAG: M20/M25/M40 family metallo-hydrolase, partial [Sphaerochaetaceae bacterium]|nr:M20/M25/M40 family metallo-hydrolase [Sphaerochaetaceae bacterium]
LDTVFKKGTTSERPYTVKDNIAYGPGVCDMKSGCLNILYAIRELSEEEKKKNLVVFFQPDEEIGSPKSRFEMKKLVSISSKCLSLESATDEDGVPVYVIQRKGILQYGYELIGKAGHAGNLLYNGAISAINEMAYWITKISSLVNKETETTANVGIVKGGTATNVVPQNASLEGEVRFWTTEEAQKARALFEELENHAKEAGIETNHYFTRYEDPWTPTPESISLAAKYNLATKKRGGLSSCNFLNSLTPVCIDGLGPSGGLAHSVDEYLCLNNIEDSVSLLLKLIFS